MAPRQRDGLGAGDGAPSHPGFSVPARSGDSSLFRWRERSPMLRRSKLTVGIGVVALIIASIAVERRSPAQETHQPAAGGHAAEATAAGGEHASAPEKTNPLKAEPTLAVWTLVVFVGLMFVLGRFAWKPLVHALHER